MLSIKPLLRRLEMAATPLSAISLSHPALTDDDVHTSMEEEFETWARQNSNRARLAHEQRRMYRNFLRDPKRKAQDQRESNIKNRLKKYILI